MYYGCTHAVVQVIIRITSCTSTPLDMFFVRASSSSAQRGITFTAPGGTGSTMGSAAGGNTTGATSKAMASGTKMAKVGTDRATAKRTVNALCTCTCAKVSQRSMASVHSGVSKTCRTLYISLLVGVHQVRATNSSHQRSEPKNVRKIEKSLQVAD